MNNYSWRATMSNTINNVVEIPPQALLLQAALAGDWVKAEQILDHHPQLASARLTPSGETALHIAALAAQPKHEHFVEMLVGMLHNDERALTKGNDIGNTALHLAAIAGNKNIAQILINATHGPNHITRIATIPNRDRDQKPISLAVKSGNAKFVEYLLQYSACDAWSQNETEQFFFNCIHAGLYGIAYKILQCNGRLATTRLNDKSPLDLLASKPSAFSSTSEQGWWTRTISSRFYTNESGDNSVFLLLKRIWREIPRQDIESNTIPPDVAEPAFAAAESGNEEFLVELLLQHPEFLYIVHAEDSSIYHIAIKHRHEPIFSLIYEIGKLKDFMATYLDSNDNTMLHLAAMLSPLSQLKCIPGAALQMHRELLWYKEVAKIVPPAYKDMKNGDGLTPHEIFMEDHKDLMKEGENWMKKTAESCLIVATLIATVVFQAAFTVPGGYNGGSDGAQAAGEPTFGRRGLFTVFVVAETVSMLSSITSIIMFLCMLTCRYTEEEFLESLPCKLISGILGLFISLAGMLAAFCTSLLLYGQKWLMRVPILLGVFACMPIMLAALKYPLLSDIVGSIWATRRMFRSRHRLSN